MFIQTENTPNPEALKFIPECEVSVIPKNYNSKEETTNSPFAAKLFDIKGVISVYLGSDFITVTKDKNTDWDLLKSDILTEIMNHSLSGEKFVYEYSENIKIDENEDEVVKEIKELIETRIRPAVANDGGDIIFHSFEDGIVKLELHGACSSCPSSTITLKNGVENMLKYYVPEVLGVEAI